MNIKNRCFVRIVSFSVAVVVALCGFILKECDAKNRFKQRLELSYKQSLSEFSSFLNDINNGLKKQLYSSSAQMSTAISTDVYKNTASAKECLSRLPISQENSQNIYKFLATAGDFSKAVAVSKDEETLQKNKKQLKNLIEFSEKFTTKISQTATAFEDSSSFAKDVDNLLKSIAKDTEFSSQTEDISQISSAIPTLIYDGPFSDHVISQKAKLLETGEFVSQTDAKAKAKKIADEDDLKYIGDEKSKTESYIFESDDSVCAITKMGGFCLYMNEQTDPDVSKVSISRAIEIAKKFLFKTYNLNFKESYYIVSENIATINFAYLENDITFYSDLIKVGVDLQDGDVVSLDARGFIMNHHKRQVYKFKHPVEKAQQKISKELSVKSVNKALVVDDALNEIYCFEVHCKTQENEDMLIYIKDSDLSEQNIFLVVHTDGGDLVL